VGELSYGNGAFAMTIVLPHEDINTFAATLDPATWHALVDTMYDATYGVSIPKFRVEYTRSLVGDLRALGMQVPFTGFADFSMMTPGGGVRISDVRHKAYVDVDEVGTEAAAVTNVTVRVISLPPCFCVDKPFIFVIRERFSGTILFVGKIVRIPA
jgi:serpin B